ncbi:anthranilate phosphoribosyltransferase [Rarobacter faecitabidus]|uniref:Anthranilate phosphoribosyltransferase n=1 Tax=Rarobacter faecitabidus TaxID=13243 RepID=A0A542ZVE3_RARFA|nr:anthranilate phosphoribosyltransferase [Rarobacter faecitabidus]TQL64334.1 anthranilate phosphoribosyltransferase [Rarobacter faecitabidus]
MTATYSWSDLTAALIRGEDLSAEQTKWAMDSVMSGQATPVQLGGFLVGLRAKGETVAEIVGLAEGMLAHALPIDVETAAVDIVGTGGDRAHTVNISTMSAVVIAAAGPLVVKHGNRAASSSSGSADVLEALGIRLDLTAERVGEIAREVGITFCFAATFHPAMRFAGQTRRELGVPTAFNFLGPLTNPGRPRAIALGVADLRMAPLMAGVLAGRGVSALVFRSGDGLDELAATGVADIWHVHDGSVDYLTVDPVRDLDMLPISRDDLRGGDAAHNAQVFRDLVAGEPGPVRDTVLLNAAAGLVADGSMAGTSPADGTVIDRLRRGIDHAATAIDSGAAARLLDRWIAATV